MNYLELAKVTAPEIWMTILGLGVLLLDAMWLKRGDTASRAKFLGGVTAVGLVITLLLLIRQCAGGVQFANESRILVVDGLTLTLQCVVVVLTIGTALISIGYEFTKHVGEYFCLLIFAAIGMNLVIATENLLMFFVALELLSICLYILTAFHKGLLRSAEASVKYFMFGALSSAFLLFGLSYLVGLTGSVTLSGMAVAIQTSLAQTGAVQPSLLLIVGMLFVIIGLGFKIAVVPFHLWAPDAYEGAPTPVAAFIATGSKVVSFVIGGKILWIGLGGVAGQAFISMKELTRGDWSGSVHFTAGWAMVLALVAMVSMIWGNVAAIQQRNVKRLLAYSSIAHAGYILVAVIAANQMGVTAVLFYLVAYSLTNLGAFGVVVVLTRSVGGDDIEDLNGLAQRAPFMALMLLIFFLSLAGIPPLAGFFGKFYLFAAAVKADPHNLGLLWLVTIAIVTSAISLYYYLIVLKHVFVLPPRNTGRIVSPAYWSVTLAVIALLVVLIGLFPQTVIDIFSALIQNTDLMLQKTIALR